MDLPTEHDLHCLMDALLCGNRTDPWHYPPRNFSDWQTAYGYFAKSSAAASSRSSPSCCGA
ncbi:hypothetical protein [Streptomyces chrestomyceticus]|uniref:hypothetical protein n=1 Tax=Streptomyces chrestomyceticus TaxID=68185 RepID=UPI003405868D